MEEKVCKETKGKWENYEDMKKIVQSKEQRNEELQKEKTGKK